LIKRIVLRLALTAILVLALAVPAFAQGQVERGPEHARSICSYSGLNDHDPEEPPGGRTQSYGQDVKQGSIKPSEVKSGAPSPGTFCNPEKGPFEGPFEQHLP
jgi:hypothetical protein